MAQLVAGLVLDELLKYGCVNCMSKVKVARDSDEPVKIVTCPHCGQVMVVAFRSMEVSPIPVFVRSLFSFTVEYPLILPHPKERQIEKEGLTFPERLFVQASPQWSEFVAGDLL